MKHFTEINNLVNFKKSNMMNTFKKINFKAFSSLFLMAFCFFFSASLSAQRFASIDDKATYVIMASFNGKVLDIPAHSKTAKTELHQWYRHNGPSQRFKFEKADNGYYYIRNLNSNMVLDVASFNKADGVPIQQYPKNNGTNQQFGLIKKGADTYIIMNRNSGKVLDVYGGSQEKGAKIMQFTMHGRENQLFKLVKLSIPPVAPCGGKWKEVASENQILSFSGIQMVRYGAGRFFVTKEVPSGTRCGNGTFGDPNPGVPKKCSICETTPPPCRGNWKAIASENQTLKLSGTKTVRYGANGKYVTKAVPSGTICGNGTFGDPIPGVVKKCSICQ